jgi:D-xylose reductase
LVSQILILHSYVVTFFIVISKLWNSHHNKDSVRKAIKVTLEDLGLDYIDLYLIHWPIPTEFVEPKNLKEISMTKEVVIERSPLHECWRAMEDLVDEGLVRNIGVSNFNVQLLLDLLTYCKYKPATLEIEHHPYLQQKRLVKWVTSQDIHIIAYASFGPSVYNGTVPRPTAHLKSFFEHPVIQKIAKKHNHGEGEILLKWAAQRGIVVIPKTVNVSRMKTNLNLFSFDLDQDDMNEIANLDCNARFNDLVEETFGYELPIFD